MTRNLYRTILVVLLLLVASLEGKAEQLPLKAYTTADGLPHNVINKIVRDSRGFLWFCTNDGLSRFDGYEFVNFGVEQGLPHPVVNDLLETREGEYWVATYTGLVKFNPNGIPSKQASTKESKSASPAPMFVVVTSASNDRYSNFINTLIQLRDGSIWCGTRAGVFRVVTTKAQFALEPVKIGTTGKSSEQDDVNSLLEDRFGTLWVGCTSGLYRRWPDGRSIRYGKQNGLPEDIIHDVLEDHNGDIWVATRVNGFFQLVNAERDAPVIKRVFNNKNGLPSNWVFDLFESSDHKLWAGSNSGLFELSLDNSNANSTLRVYTKRNGFTYHEIPDVTEDRDGNLWLGSVNGAMKLARGGFTTFTERDGLCCVRTLFQSPGGEFYAHANVNTDRLPRNDNSEVTYTLELGHFEGEHFTWLIPDALKNKRPGWSPQPIALQSGTGEWWIGTAEGLFVFPSTGSFASLKNARAIANYTTKDGLASMEIFCIYEDSHCDVWVSTIGPTNGLARWDHATRTMHDMSQTDGLPSLKERVPTAFAEDRSGNLWVGFSQGELARYRDGHFTLFTTSDGLPTGRVDNLFLDRDGGLWIAIRRALVHIEDPTTERPNFITYTTAQGLSSNYVTAVTQDHSGRLYIATGMGVDRLEPTTGRIKHYTTADGLALGEIVTALCDRNGSIWIGTSAGLSRLQPEPTERSEAPPILIKGLSVAGVSQHISAIGDTAISLADLSPNQNQLQIDFVGLSFVPGDVLNYQYRLEGTASDWSPPSPQRTINFANLAAGHYRFMVRAVNSDGTVSTQPAVISFVILPPVWQKWWFIMFVAAIAAVASYALYRYRVSRLLELERVRTRIASDLHDDIGAGLSRLAILSEVARHEAGATTVGEQLGEIAQGSRQLVDSMSDIVWVINPRRDQLRDLVQRMRRFASDLFTASGIEFTFQAPDELDIKVGADVRRQLFMIFKEAVNNVARHSACRKAEIELATQDGLFTFSIKDNGRGFDPTETVEGNGLLNMRERARLLKGKLTVASQPAAGTSIKLEAPLKANIEERNGRLRGFPSI